jgi:hypothetical protein
MTCRGLLIRRIYASSGHSEGPHSSLAGREMVPDVERFGRQENLLVELKIFDS